MKLKSIQLKNFRNYTTCAVSFSSGINLVLGNNAQGKTNLLEAVYFCALGKSPRTKKEVNLIYNDAPSANIKLNFESLYGDKTIDITINRVGKKQILVNRSALSKLSSLIGELRVVYFSPDELRLIKDMPEDRRRFLDISISQFDKSYLLSLSKYDKVLKQMNAIVKKHLSESEIRLQLDAYTPQFIACAEKIINSRIEFINNLKSYAKKVHFALCDNEELNIEYGFIPPKNVNLKDYLQTQLDKTLSHSLELGYITVGPHRDDIQIAINGKSCKIYSSQGQQRTVSLSLKLASMEIIRNETGEDPILLLDDVMSELDAEREQRLCELIKNYQTLITSTRDNITTPKNIIHVNHGEIK